MREKWPTQSVTILNFKTSKPECADLIMQEENPQPQEENTNVHGISNEASKRGKSLVGVDHRPSRGEEAGREVSRLPSPLGRRENGAGLNWMTTLFMLLFHLGAVAAFFFISWANLIVAASLYLLAVNVGIGMGYHRLLTHRGYRVPKAIEYTLAICGTLALEGGPIGWVGTHRIHHQHSDQEGDPHTPREGKWWAHVGWILSGRAMHSETHSLARYVPDLTRDRFYLWLSSFHWIPLSGVGSLLFGVGIYCGGFRAGVGLFLWGIFLRVTLGLHATWLVNSATHLQGRRRFTTRDNSRNNWWVALLTGGEGWHNNHHANPASARHGLAWYEFDPNYYGIWLLKKLGLATKVYVAKLSRGTSNSSREEMPHKMQSYL